MMKCISEHKAGNTCGKYSWVSFNDWTKQWTFYYLEKESMAEASKEWTREQKAEAVHTGAASSAAIANVVEGQAPEAKKARKGSKLADKPETSPKDEKKAEAAKVMKKGIDANLAKMKLLKVRCDGVISQHLQIKNAVESKDVAWDWCWRRMPMLDSSKQALDEALRANDFWADWSLSTQQNFAATAKKKYPVERMMKEFSYMPTIDNLVDMFEGRVAQTNAMYKASLGQ
jgi:hypothetical protein